MHSTWIAAACVTVLLFAAAACGGTSSSDKTATAAARGGANPASAPTRASTSPSAAASTAAGTQKNTTVTARDFSFSADDISVSKGDVINITFKNSGSTSHTLTFFTDKGYTTPIAGADTGSASAGSTKMLTVTADSGLYYRCKIHPTQMQGEIQIQ